MRCGLVCNTSACLIVCGLGVVRSSERSAAEEWEKGCDVGIRQVGEYLHYPHY